MPPATPAQTPDRFRPASDFPQNISGLERTEAESLYVEMRACLVFTNRSRGQLMRRSQEYKDKALQLQSDMQRLDALIKQLQGEKMQIEASKRQVIAELNAEFATVTRHLDELSNAFEDVQNFEEMLKSPMGLMANPGRFIQFLRKIASIVRFWRQPDQPDAPPLDTEQDRRERPWLYEGTAETNRSLLDR